MRLFFNYLHNALYLQILREDTSVLIKLIILHTNSYSTLFITILFCGTDITRCVHKIVSVTSKWCQSSVNLTSYVKNEKQLTCFTVVV
jgi:hypothetical protein